MAQVPVTAVIIPANESWLHTPEMREKLARAEAWMREHPPQESNLDELESQLSRGLERRCK